MMRITRFVTIIVAVGILAAVMGGCHPANVSNPSGTPSRIIARADFGYQLAEADFMQKLKKSMLVPNGGSVPDSALSGFLDSILVDTLTGFAADQVDLSRSFPHTWSYRTRVNSLLLYNYMEAQLSGISVDSAEAAAFYEQNKERFRISEEVEISHILSTASGLLNGPDSLNYRVVPESVLQRSTKDYIDMVRRKLDSGMAFADAARQYSHAGLAKKDGGYFGLTGRGQFHAPFDSIAFQLTPGSYSQPYQDRDGWHIIYLHKYVEAGIRPFSDTLVFNAVSQQILNEKIRKRAEAVFDSLNQGLTVTVNESLLDSNMYNTTDSLWIGIINGIDTVDVLTMRNAEESIKRRMKTWNTTPDQKRQVINLLARQYAVVQAARRDGLDTLPAARAKMAEMKHQEAKAFLIEQWFDLDWQPTDSAVEAYFKNNPKEFVVEKPLTVQHILTQDSSTAIFVRDQARAGVDFMELAKEFYTGEVSVRTELADLGKIGPNDVDSMFYKAARVLLPGDISDPIKTRYGFHIIKLVKSEPSRTLDDAHVDIVSRLTKEYQMAGFWKIRDGLFSQYHVKFSNRPKKVFLEPYAYRKN
jgi:parvulin-like peptidyl-prolyl isomerase